MSERVKLHWQANFGAYGGRKSRQACVYYAFVEANVKKRGPEIALSAALVQRRRD